MPLAPGLFSTTKGWPVLSSMYLPTSRAVMSPDPPGANGTMMRIALAGKVSACARAFEVGRAARTGRAKKLRRDSGMRKLLMALQFNETLAHGQRDARSPTLQPWQHLVVRRSTAFALSISPA